MSAQPERERILTAMVVEMEKATEDFDRGRDLRGPVRPAPLELLAEAALRVIETPSSSKQEGVLQCTCGHSGYVQRDGPHAPDCPVGKS